MPKTYFSRIFVCSRCEQREVSREILDEDSNSLHLFVCEKCAPIVLDELNQEVSDGT